MDRRGLVRVGTTKNGWMTGRQFAIWAREFVTCERSFQSLSENQEGDSLARRVPGVGAGAAREAGDSADRQRPDARQSIRRRWTSSRQGR
jgi:hypothetical protein